MSISMKASVTLYDYEIANAMDDDAEFAASVFNQLRPIPSTGWTEEFLENLGDKGKSWLAALAKAMEVANNG